jgi:tetrahydromethanopterin S-methyltransferase subunit H
VVAALQTDKDTLTSALDLFKKELFAYMDFLYDLFEKSPFFITSADAATASAHEGMSEHSIPARDVFTESVTASAEDVEAGAMLRVQFTLDKKDLKFSVVYRESEDAPESSQKVVLEEKTVASTDGLFDASVKLIAPGIYTARWDNSYSRMTAKTIRFEVDLMHSSSSPGASSS